MKKPDSLLLIVLVLFIQSFNSHADPSALNIVSQNLHRFFDDKDDGNHEKMLTTVKYQQRLNKLLEKIATEYKFADVIAFQEVENKAILQDISNLLKKTYHENYQAVLIEGNDISGIDVGFLVKQNIQINSIKTLYRNKLFTTKGEKLFSRPPLAIKLCSTECITFVNVHLRSMRGLKSSSKQKRVSLKRRLQAETLARWIDKFQHQDVTNKLIILGDFNALTPSDVYADSLGTIIGKPDQIRPKWKSPDLIKSDLIDVSLMVRDKDRYSYKYRKRKQLLDYLLISKNLKHKIKSISFSRIDYKFSDHAALKAELMFD